MKQEHLTLLEAAAKASDQAYAPYSEYQVGAAIQCGDGKIFTGCNVENASYGLTNCAERTAVFKAISEGAHEMVAVAIVAGGTDVPYPCGACRQVLSEFCQAETPVLIAKKDHLDQAELILLGTLLPHSFSLKKRE